MKQQRDAVGDGCTFDGCDGECVVLICGTQSESTEEDNMLEVEMVIVLVFSLAVLLAAWALARLTRENPG